MSLPPAFEHFKNLLDAHQGNRALALPMAEVHALLAAWPLLVGLAQVSQKLEEHDLLLKEIKKGLGLVTTHEKEVRSLVSMVRSIRQEVVFKTVFRLFLFRSCST